MDSMHLDIPIIQAPMAGITTPELIAAVSNTGALGSLGAGYMAPHDIRSAIKQIRSLTKKPFNVNLFIPEKPTPPCDLSSMTKLLSSLWSELSDAPFDAILLPPPSFEKQIEVLFEEEIPIFSFTFGIPHLALIERFQKQGTLVWGTATTPQEAELLEQAKVDAIICQGQEAGGHRGNFSSFDPLYGLAPLLILTKKKVRTPLIAAGGIMNGSSAAAALALGAIAVQLGTAFITVKESGASAIYKESLLKKPNLPTGFTKAFTGKPARSIINAFMQKLEEYSIPPYPIQHYLTYQLRSMAAQNQRPDLMSLWAGQGYPLCQDISATALIKQIVEELSQAQGNS